MSSAKFATRDQLAGFEWDNQRKDWKRPPVDREVLKQLSRRSTLNGALRALWFLFLLAVPAVAACLLARVSPWLAIPALYVYYFFYGFWVAIGHELQHKTVFAESEDWLSEIFFFLVQTLMWNSPTYARISHRLHHRYTMVRNVDPETDWPEVITSKWLRWFLVKLVAQVLVVGALVTLFVAVRTQVLRVAGARNRMMTDHCTEAEIAAIRRESLAILMIHAAVAAAAVAFHAWPLLALVTLAWQIGSPMELLWHATKHIARPYNVNDHRLNTRSIRVSWFVRTFFWGLDDHVDHHLYPVVPSRNLRKLHKLLEKDLPDPENIFGCWAEMFEISKEKDKDPRAEFVSVGVADGAPEVPASVSGRDPASS
ncbi:MAG TPA: fatty acid desaturase [Spirochaetia bacterium]|nr:fatty acid desaturase [Spirochaetia bacterium]